MKVRANAETVADTSTARRFGAEGIGLSRTEHMFFGADRIGAMRRVIMAEDETGRRAGLAELLPIQREDFAEIFRIMKGFPVTIRRSMNFCPKPRRSSARWRGSPAKPAKTHPIPCDINNYN